ncbi:fungal-specific transcription factor domain-containing protein [Mycena maculata]|uniref:Fungal-specific transcription factor domain-containing protein n=1 Tax=Mycena maculata TaxID=230809 RepID=A0AAD7K621_9AGAR|nr:fungal-specific transcription factor domain-containing protein [Mycena maculata]
MPQAVKKDISSQRAQEKESKRARGALSCAECRRLKLKCDKTVPCSSCKRRGCSAICPNGSLITGQGTRFVLADTEKLHSKIATMSDRIRLLEDALAILQSTVTSEPHPLLNRELLKIKSSIELHSAVEGEEGNVNLSLGGGDGGTETEECEEYIDAFGTLAIREDGAATFYGRSAGSESLLMVMFYICRKFQELTLAQGENGSAAPSPIMPRGMVSNHTLAAALGPSLLRRQESPGYHASSASISSFTSSFPFSTDAAPGIDLDYLTERLPSYAEAVRFCELYLAQAPWFFGAVTRDQLTDEILPLWYPDAAARGGSPPPLGTAHDLALLYVIFCFGALGDTALPFPTSHGTGAADDLQTNIGGPYDAEYFYRLTKAALTLEPVLEGPPSVATVQTLALMAIFEGLCAGENSIESTWAIFGLSTKLAQSIGLHRDCARWGLKPPEVQKRRALFWELFITDCWQALATGRLPTFSLPFVDCELPQDVGQTMAEDGTPQSSFPYWKARFGAECVSAVVQGTLTSRAPRYSIILELDRKVRDMEFPKYVTGPPPQGLGMSQTMSHFMPINYRHLTLLYIHRCFFAHAISNHPNDPIKSPYAPSFLAGYRSACDLLGSLRQQFDTFPAEIARFWVLWTHAFSSAAILTDCQIMLSSVVTHATRSKVAPAALLELSKACELFREAAEICPNSRAGKFVPILTRVTKKAVQVFEEARNGAPAIIPNNIFEPSRPDSSNDELAIFSGKTHTLTTKAKTRPNQASVSSPASARSLSDSPKETFMDHPSFAGVHPSLVNELNGFEGHINAQIQNGYYPNGVYAQPMIIQAQHEQDQYQLQGQVQYEQLQLRDHEEYRRQQREAEELRFRQQQQQQQQHQQQQQQVHHANEYPYPPQTYDPYPPAPRTSHGIAAPAPIALADATHSQGHPQHTLVHSSSHRSLRQAYHHQPPAQLPQSHSQTNLHQMVPDAPRPVSHSQSHRSLRQTYEAQQHAEHSPHEQYSVSPTYKRHPSQMQSPTDHGSSSSQGTTPDAGYMDTSPVHSPYQTMNPHYWPDGTYAPPAEHPQAQPRGGFEVQPPPQDPRLRQRVQLDQQLRQINLQLGQPQTDHYTPDGALRGLAAEDPRLQEHWQSLDLPE